jgi:hypothetical protein
MLRRHLRRNLIAYLALFAALSSSGYAATNRARRAAPNDNRDNAQLLPTFPTVTEGTTVDATVERLDPQRSACGRVDATVWYRIESAPDGTIVATVQASGALAPVVHIYRRNPSNIAEVACGAGQGRRQGRRRPWRGPRGPAT